MTEEVQRRSTEMTKFFPEYGSDYSFPSFEKKVQNYWEAGSIFKKSLREGQGREEFFFYDGPPFATGLPHYGHILAGTIKDIVPRYWTMRGYTIPRRFGWDTHGLPVEFEMEKTLELKGSLDIQEYGVAKFNEACRSVVLRYAAEWRKVVERMGRWVDMDDDYKTMDPEFMESVWWVFKELWDQDLVYRGNKVVPYSWRLTAALSNFEASLNYKDVQDPAITVVFSLKTEKWKDTGLAVWTTTPWTLPSNLALAVGDIEYGVYELKEPLESASGHVKKVVFATALAANFADLLVCEGDENGSGENTGKDGKKKQEPKLIQKLSKDDLLGESYAPLFDCFKDHENAFQILDGSSFVTDTDGTGVVHMAPAFGEDDYFLCDAAGISVVDPTDVECKFTEAVGADAELAGIVGKFVKDADKDITKTLKQSKKRLLKQDVLQHAYPYCYRSNEPLIYKAIPSWYVRVEPIKEQMLANNQQIDWVPSHIKDGRFGKWLENARDWCVSRNRFWGTPIPIWVNEKDEDDVIVIGSREELEKLTGKEVPDLHKHFTDELVIEKDGNRYVRTSEVLDCWFESGSMPYAQQHYPFENKEKLEGAFPADFIAEGLDQTRGWFYTLTVLGTAISASKNNGLKSGPAFKNCIVNGMVLAEDGKKMSKSLRNYPDPNVIFDKYGADALRLYLMQSPAMHAEELRFSERGLVELMRAVMLPLWNSYSFFASYANIDGWDPKKASEAPSEADRAQLDRWILARVKQAEALIHEKMEVYRLSEVAPIQIELIDDLTNWYIRLNRDRYWGEANDETAADKGAAYSTLWTVLSSLARILAPGLPFISETLNAALNGCDLDKLEKSADFESVHLAEYDKSKLELSREEKDLLEEVDLAKKVILLGRSLRGEAKIGLRQPLPSLRVAGLSEAQQSHLKTVEALILSEINVKNLEMVNKASDLVEEKIRPNFRVLGKKAGKKVKDIQKELAAWGAQEIASFESSGSATVCGVECGKEDLEIVREAKDGRFAQAGYGLVAELDTAISDELRFEGVQREVVNRIQQRRKEMQLHLSDRIEVKWKVSKGDLLKEVLLKESQSPSFVSEETLSLKFEESSDALSVDETTLADQSFQFEIEARS